MGHLLIIDDDTDTREILADICRYMGHDIDIAPNGQVGLQKAQHRKPDLIILDIMMPEMNGLQFLARLRALPNLSNIPVIVLSAINSQQMLRNEGIAAVFHKSHMKVADLREKIAVVLEQPMNEPQDVLASC